MKANRLQAVLARRREAEQIKIEKSVATEKYYDKWGRITSRYEQWTTPEYYKQADENFKKHQEDKLKNENLQIRREKLKTFLSHENLELDKLLNEKRKPKKFSTDTLSNVHQIFKRTEEEKRKLELESRLYKRWRNGFCEESILLDSRSDHEALAKMNWLDKQVANQLKCEREKKESEERQLRLQEESRKHTELLDNRIQNRDREIKELHEYQTRHLEELKLRESESNDLRELEERGKQLKKTLTEELYNLELISIKRKEMVCRSYNNMNKIKMFLRTYAKLICNYLQDDIDLLKRIHTVNATIGETANFSSKNVKIKSFIDKFQSQYELELEKQKQIENMYESEAKHMLLKQQEYWTNEMTLRENFLKNQILEQIEDIEQQIRNGNQRRKELSEIRESHLKTINNSNGRIQDLLAKQKTDEDNICIKDIGINNMNVITDPNGNFKDNNGLSDKLQTLHIGNGTSIHQTSNHANSYDNHINNFVPKYGRKKVAWT